MPSELRTKAVECRRGYARHRGKNNAALAVECDVSQILIGEASEFDLLEVAGAHLPRESVGHVLRQTVPETRPSSADRKAKNLDRTLRCPYRKELCL